MSSEKPSASDMLRAEKLFEKGKNFWGLYFDTDWLDCKRESKRIRLMNQADRYHKLARKYLAASLSLFSGNAEAWWMLAVFTKDPSVGAEMCLRAVSLNSEFAKAWWTLGLNLERMNRSEEAAECMRVSKEIDEGKKTSHLPYIDLSNN